MLARRESILYEIDAFRRCKSLRRVVHAWRQGSALVRFVCALGLYARVFVLYARVFVLYARVLVLYACVFVLYARVFILYACVMALKYIHGESVYIVASLHSAGTYAYAPMHVCVFIQFGISMYEPDSGACVSMNTGTRSTGIEYGLQGIGYRV